VIKLRSLSALQFHESFLHDIAGAVAIAQNARCILQQRQLEAAQKRREVNRWNKRGIGHNSSRVLTRRPRNY
jgi:hypothetical protein